MDGAGDGDLSALLQRADRLPSLRRPDRMILGRGQSAAGPGAQVQHAASARLGAPQPRDPMRADAAVAVHRQERHVGGAAQVAVDPHFLARRAALAIEQFADRERAAVVQHHAGVAGDALHRRQMHDVLAGEVIRNPDAFGKDPIQNQHLRLRFELDPRHVVGTEVVSHRHRVAFEDRQIVIEVFTLERVGDHGLVLHTTDIFEAAVAQRARDAFQLPGRGIGAGKREVPGDVVLENGRARRIERTTELGQFHQPLDVVEDAIGCDPEDGDACLTTHTVGQYSKAPGAMKRLISGNHEQ